MDLLGGELLDHEDLVHVPRLSAGAPPRAAAGPQGTAPRIRPPRAPTSARRWIPYATS
ncbi:hypothetical protein N9L68_00420 [bacterium]|nr:hypothetical protein [bacterium]